jgi:hypothetical protein
MWGRSASTERSASVVSECDSPVNDVVDSDTSKRADSGCFSGGRWPCSNYRRGNHFRVRRTATCTRTLFPGVRRPWLAAMISPLAALRWNRNLPDLSLLISNLAAMAVLPVRFSNSGNATTRCDLAHARSLWVVATRPTQGVHPAAHPPRLSTTAAHAVPRAVATKAGASGIYERRTSGARADWLRTPRPGLSFRTEHIKRVPSRSCLRSRLGRRERTGQSSLGGKAG